MYNYPLSMIASFIALGLIVSSYFVRKKIFYLMLQGIGIIFLVLSYLFIEEFFAMISLSIGLGRTITFFLYEKKDKKAPIWLACLFSGLTIVSYFIVNLWILGTAKSIDIIYLISLCLYAFTFRIRDLKIMRYAVVAPNSLAVIYNIAISAPIFTVLSYAFELTANIVAIIQFNIEKQNRLKREEGKKIDTNKK